MALIGTRPVRELDQFSDVALPVQPARDNLLDALKGVAITLVVVGHAVQAEAPRPDDNLLFRAIYAFHMPFFMLLAGFGAGYSRNVASPRFISSRVRSLVVPFLAWYVVSYGIDLAHGRATSISNYAHRLVVSPDVGLWFLWVLFLSLTLLWIALRSERYLGRASIPLTWALLQAVPVHALGVPLLKFDYAFVAAGFLARRHRVALRRIAPTLGLIAIPLFAIALGPWRRVAEPSFGPWLHAHLTGTVLHPIAQCVIKGYPYLVAALGCSATLALLVSLSRRHPAARPLAALAWLGLFTLDIYVTNAYFSSWGLGSGALHVITGSLQAIACSLLVGRWIIRPVPLLDTVFLGGRARKTPAPPGCTSVSAS